MHRQGIEGGREAGGETGRGGGKFLREGEVLRRAKLLDRRERDKRFLSG